MAHPQLENPSGEEDRDHGAEEAAKEAPATRKAAGGSAEQETKIPKNITRAWVEKQVAQTMPHLGVDESPSGIKGFYKTKGGLDATFTPVGETWRAVAERLKLIPAE